MSITQGSAKIDLVSTQTPAGWDFVLQVWNQSYDNPNGAHRNSLITKVELINLPSPPPQLTPTGVVDRSGNDIRTLWPNGNLTPQSAGFLGYSERSDSLGTLWAMHAGIYDERCAGEPAIDAFRLRTHKSVRPPALAVYEYIAGPVIFSFSLSAFTPPGTVRITIGFIGGRAGTMNPYAEEEVISLP
jgi:hypothetical protein